MNSPPFFFSTLSKAPRPWSSSPEVWRKGWEHLKSARNVEENRQDERGSQVSGLVAFKQCWSGKGIWTFKFEDNVKRFLPLDSFDSVTFGEVANLGIFNQNFLHRETAVDSLPCRTVPVVVGKTNSLENRACCKCGTVFVLLCELFPWPQLGNIFGHFPR